MTENSEILTPTTVEPVEPVEETVIVDETASSLGQVMHYQIELQTPSELMQLYGTALGAVLCAAAITYLILKALNVRRSL